MKSDLKTFWIGERPGTRMFPAPVPANRAWEEYLLTGERVFVLEIEEYGLERFGKYDAGAFKVYEGRELTGYAFLHFDVLCLLQDHPTKVVETNRGDEHFFYRLLQDEQTVTIEQWGSQGDADVTLTQAEWKDVMERIRTLPEGEQIGANDTLVPAIVCRRAKKSDRPDWCDECSHPEDECTCKCWDCGKRGKACICEKKEKEQYPTRSPEGLRLDWLGHAEEPLDYGHNLMYHTYIMTREHPVITASVSDRYYMRETWDHNGLHLREYSNAQRANECVIYLETLNAVKDDCQRGTEGTLRHAIFGRDTFHMIISWDEQGVTLSEEKPVLDGGIITLPWNVWELLIGSLPEFKAYHAMRKKEMEER